MRRNLYVLLQEAAYKIVQAVLTMSQMLGLV